MTPRNLCIIVARHGERADTRLGSNWLEKYRRYNGRHPQISHLTHRRNFEDWRFDTALTVDGEWQAKATGRKLAQLGYKIDYCYSSPAYRSIQTANKMVEAQGRKKHAPIKIEPGLFECPSWYQGVPFRFISPRTIRRDKYFNIDRSYHPVFDYVDSNEDESDYYARSHHFTNSLIEAHESEGPVTILLTGHASSIEIIGKSLTNEDVPPEALARQSGRVNFCNFAIFEYDAESNKWRTRASPSHDYPIGSMETIQTSIPLHIASTQYYMKDIFHNTGHRRKQVAIKDWPLLSHRRNNTHDHPDLHHHHHHYHPDPHHQQQRYHPHSQKTHRRSFFLF